MGSMASSPLSLACTIVPIVISLVQGQLVKRQAAALEQLKDKAPHILKPPKTPKQMVHEAYAKKREIVITLIIVAVIVTATVMTSARPDLMSWSFFFDLDENADLYKILREAGLGLTGVAALIMIAHHTAYYARLSYVSQYWNVPHDIDMSPTALSFLYAQRDEELDLQSLRSGVFWLVRDPETFANRIFFIGIVMLSCSWLLLIIFGMITILVEAVVVKRDMVWVLLYGPVYHIYRANRGGQFYCTCLNKSESRLENLIRQKQQELAEITTTITITPTTPAPAEPPTPQQHHTVYIQNDSSYQTQQLH